MSLSDLQITPGNVREGLIEGAVTVLIPFLPGVIGIFRSREVGVKRAAGRIDGIRCGLK